MLEFNIVFNILNYINNIIINFINDQFINLFPNMSMLDLA